MRRIVGFIWWLKPPVFSVNLYKYSIVHNCVGGFVVGFNSGANSLIENKGYSESSKSQEVNS